jgi:hypothetical protein
MNSKDSKRQINNIIIVYLIGIIFSLILVIYREIINHDIDFLQSNIIYKCNSWCIGHFIHYLVLGYLAPNYLLLLIFCGFIFELIEIPLNKLTRYIDSKIIHDTFVNTLGVILGYFLFKIFPKKIYLSKYFL